jgi:hypothetical protein
MNEREMDWALAQAFQKGLGLGQEQEDALWADFTTRAAREAAGWAAFAAGLVMASRYLRAALHASGWAATHNLWRTVR